MIAFPSIEPEIFTISVLGFEFALRWYALSYIAGFLLALFIMRFFLRRSRLWRNGIPPMEMEQADDLLTYLILGVIAGGRIGYVAFYNLHYYLENPTDILKVWDGGMSFHGGFIGVVAGLVYFCVRNGIQIVPCGDLLAVASAPGLFFGRIANFINAELWGKPTGMPWGVVFPGDLAQHCPTVIGECARHPTQLYEAASEGLLMFLFLLLLASLGGLRRPGLLTGFFLLLYGAARFIIEFYRVPDPQFFSVDNPFGFAYRIGEYGVTMGQLLSLPMILFGIIFLLFAANKVR